MSETEKKKSDVISIVGCGNIGGAIGGGLGIGSRARQAEYYCL